MSNTVMKNGWGTGVAVSVMLGALVTPSLAADPGLNILVYGNSFMAAANVPDILTCTVDAAGKPHPNVVNAAVFSMDLAYHIANTTSVVINPYSGNPISGISATTGQPTNFISDNTLNNSASGKWNYVVLQEESSKPTDAVRTQATAWGVPYSVSNATAFKNDAQTLYGMVKADSPAVKPVLCETWARYPGISPIATEAVGARWTDLDTMYPTLTASKTPAAYLNASNQMQSELKKYYGQAKTQIDGAFPGVNTLITPAGDAMKGTGKALYDASYEGYDPSYWETISPYRHESAKGAVMTALLLYRTIYQANTSDISYSSMQSYMSAHRGGLQSNGIPDAASWNALTAYVDSVPISVPEPTSLSLLAIGSGFLLRRRARSV
jgi:hypothetical protein